MGRRKVKENDGLSPPYKLNFFLPFKNLIFTKTYAINLYHKMKLHNTHLSNPSNLNLPIVSLYKIVSICSLFFSRVYWDLIKRIYRHNFMVLFGDDNFCLINYGFVYKGKSDLINYTDHIVDAIGYMLQATQSRKQWSNS